jgi:putative DNA primase/helicase
LAPGDYVPIPETPTLEDAQSAAGLLLDLVDEFPFEGPSDSAAWLAYLLTLISRPAIQGATPVWAFNANQAGSGKTLLADLAHRIAFGRTVPIKTVDPETPGGKAEMRNEITACVVEGLPAVLWDNVRGRIASPQFEAAVTALTWSARLYHSNSENITEPMRIVFAVTGNNLEIGGDSSRRWIACELLSADERPENRQFKRSRIREYVDENRHKYVAAALTILRYRWSVGTMDRGSLQEILPPIGSFEGWSAIVRDAVYLATDLDPWSTNEKVRAFDADADTLDLIHETLRGQGWTSAEIVDQATSDGGGYMSQMLDAIGCGANPTAQKVGKRLKPFLRRPRNGWRLIENKGSKGLSRWSVVPVPRSLPLEATAESPPDERKPPF